MTTLYQWEDAYSSSMTTERYGQAFCNQFIKAPWPELFYADTAIARSMIAQWLMDNHYWPNMPDRKNQFEKV